MWQQNWQPEQPKPTNGVDWASAAQQWMENKKFYEQWQQQTYQQHMQMMAAAHAAQMAQCIDPSVVSNPPPPPPESSVLRKEVDLSSRLNDSGDAKDDSKSDSDGLKSNGQFSKFKNQHLLNNPKLVSTGIMPNKSKLPYVGKDLAKSAIAANEQIKSAMGLNEENLEKYLNDAPDMAQLNGTDMTDKSQKQLPLWLREGLEKIKQEKEKKKNDPPKPTIETVFSKDSDSDDSEEDAKQVRKDRLQHATNESKLTTSTLKNGKTSASSGKHAEQSSAGRLPSYTSSSSSSSKLELNDDEKQELIV